MKQRFKPGDRVIYKSPIYDFFDFGIYIEDRNGSALVLWDSNHTQQSCHYENITLDPISRSPLWEALR